MTEPRALLTRAELSAWLTAELQKVPDAEGSEVTVQYTLREPDAAGCNWSETVVLRVGQKASVEYLQPHVRHLVEVARTKFNVSVDS